MQTQIDIVENLSQGLPSFSGTLERINVLLGANGSGKSKLLLYLTAHSNRFFGEGRTAVFIEGGRPVQIDVNVGLSNQTINVFSNPLQVKEQYRTQKRSPLAGRLGRTFYLLHALENDEKIKHSDAVEEWKRGDQKTPIPIRPKPPITRLAELFSEVFPLMKIEVTEANQGDYALLDFLI